MKKGKKYQLLFGSIVIMNFVLRLVIYYSIGVYRGSISSVHLDGVNKIASGENIPLISGNFLFAISYIGYFFKHFLGSLNYFFVFNSLLGTSASVIISLLVYKLTNNGLVSVITMGILTIYTEFMVFSSVFYTPIINIFLLSLLLLDLYYYYGSENKLQQAIYLLLALLITDLTLLFKPELFFLPVFLIILAVILRKKRRVGYQTLVLSIVLSCAVYGFSGLGIMSFDRQNVIANDFIFFGHTDYGGDLGEGAFIYSENKVRYDDALKKYCDLHGILHPTQTQINKFHWVEIRKFIFQHPIKWVDLQLTKFFRTFGVVPESTSFKILYSGLFNGKVWITALFVVSPVAVLILLLIFVFNLSSINDLFNSKIVNNLSLRKRMTKHNNKEFLYFYLMLFVYYLIAAIFIGQYQERYRMPIMVFFIIPTVSYFLGTFNNRIFFRKTVLMIKGVLIILFLIIWILQAKKAISNKERLDNVIESVSKDHEIKTLLFNR